MSWQAELLAKRCRLFKLRDLRGPRSVLMTLVRIPDLPSSWHLMTLGSIIALRLQVDCQH